MSGRRRWVHAGLTLFYFGVSWSVLLWYTSDDPFCAPSGINNHILVSARLALACTAWDFRSGIGGAWSARVMSAPKLAPFLRAVIAALGVGSIPFWLFRGYGVWLFQGTWADVSCLFTEEFGMAFPFVVAPSLGIVSLLHGVGRHAKIDE